MSTRLKASTATIASSGTTSNAIFIGGDSLVGIILPAAITSTTLAIHASHDGTTYNAMYDTAGNAVSLTIAASQHLHLAPATFSSANYIKLVCGSAEGAEREIQVIFRKVD